MGRNFTFPQAIIYISHDCPVLVDKNNCVKILAPPHSADPLGRVKGLILKFPLDQSVVNMFTEIFACKQRNILNMNLILKTRPNPLGGYRGWANAKINFCQNMDVCISNKRNEAKQIFCLNIHSQTLEWDEKVKYCSFLKVVM